MRIGYTSAPLAFEPDELLRRAAGSSPTTSSHPTAVEGSPPDSEGLSRHMGEETGIDVVAERQVVSNIADCSADPGALTAGQAERAHVIHRYCSPECLVRRRAEVTMNALAPGDPALGISPDRTGIGAD